MFAIMRGLPMRFNGILHSRSSEELDEWIDDAINTEFTAIMRFASVLRRDIDRQKCNRTPVEQRTSRRVDQPPQDAEASNVGRAGPELMTARMLPLNHRN